MLDRIDSATSRQRTFVGDAAHELRSPLASLRVQLEVSQRLGPQADWAGLIDDVLVDVDRLDRLVDDLLTLARLDESGSLRRREPVALDELVESVGAGYGHARVPVRVQTVPDRRRRRPRRAAPRRRSTWSTTRCGTRAPRSASCVRAGPAPPGARSRCIVVEDDGPGIPEAERAAGLRPLLPRAGVALARDRRHRARPADRARHRAQPRRPGPAGRPRGRRAGPARHRHPAVGIARRADSARAR